MTQPSLRPRLRLRLLSAGFTCAVAALPLLTPACLSRPLETAEPRTTTTVDIALAQTRIDKIDILLSIDDSGSMADKQSMLAVAVPKLVEALVSPPCTDVDGQVVVRLDDPLADCPAGSRRPFDPVLDIHIGIISTSLGSRGGTVACSDDNAMLLSRVLDGAPLATYQDKGFLAWQPEAEQDEAGLYRDPLVLVDDLIPMVEGVGQVGCGYEAQLESWYRFLADPDPYASIEKKGSNTVLVGTDETLLQQRADFLRPDSLVAVVMLSDENDCSFRAEGKGFRTSSGSSDQGVMTLVPRSECAVDPNDACCAPCGQAAETCPDDPACAQPPADENLLINLTCYQQKRRFGVDLLYPTERYVAAVRDRQVSDRQGNLVDNPLLVAADGTFRGADHVYLAGIVGVPWQLVARDPSDLTHGLKDADELLESDTWSAILGDPDAYVPPTDPHMVESIYPRAGLPPTNSAAGTDPINGHEYDVSVQPVNGNRPSGDLQYSCTFALPVPFECGDTGCDCSPQHAENNPLCQAPDGSYGTTQYRAKAYPSLRQLSVLKGVGSQGIVGSICPAQFDDPDSPDFGYLPAIEALVTRLGEKLSDPCLPRSLNIDASGQVACPVLEGRQLDADSSCNCDGAGRTAVTSEHQPAVGKARGSALAGGLDLDCFCEIEQLGGAELDVCQEQLDDAPTLDGDSIHGWCYVDGDVDGGGNEQLVAHCPETERHTVRFVGEGEPTDKARVFITCQQESGS